MGMLKFLTALSGNSYSSYFGNVHGTRAFLLLPRVICNCDTLPPSIFRGQRMAHDTFSLKDLKALTPGHPSRFELPAAPAGEEGLVKAWSEPVEMLTYRPAEPDKNPLFLERRVYQGSSGRVYPLPVIDSIETEPHVQAWQAVHIENEFLRLMIMPEIGGRIHVGLDKRSGYDFFYRQNVIKPALVGLAGPWISGGVEFNWPQHHRPATFMPVEVSIERSADGSVTVWCSDHDPISRMKGMHGICLHPGKAYLEVKVRLYNRTEDTQTFLWWANVATRVHEKYQSFFPHDVRYAADHAKRAVTEYPLSQGIYYGVDYGERGRHGVPASELPAHFVPDGSYPANDLGWYANIPVPTSYMIVGSREDFFGGYDHAADAGTVAVANHHISPGKKQWTWGNHDFGYAWDRSLTDSDGPYVELMSGVYTDNQPDFSFLAPGETKTFSQYWYPIGAMGVPDLANLDGALRLEVSAGKAVVHLQVTSDRPNCAIELLGEGREIGRWSDDLSVNSQYRYSASFTGSSDSLEVRVSQDGNTFLRYSLAEIVPAGMPDVATEPPLPEDVAGNDELYLIGLHLEQYRHPTRDPEPYWLEAVRRDAADSRANNALGRFYMRQGRFLLAEQHLRSSIARITRRNPNPSDGEPYYNLGLTLSYQGRASEAYDAFYKSTWNAAWRSPGYHRLAEIDCSRGEWLKALDHLDRSLRADADNLNALNLKAAVLCRLGRDTEARALLGQIHSLDPLDATSRFLATGKVFGDAQQQIDLAFDLIRAGLLDEALNVLLADRPGSFDGGATIRLYVLADVLHRLGRNDQAIAARSRAAAADPAYVFPSRLEEMLIFERAIDANPEDGHAHFYLGNLLYDRRRYGEAIERWERSTEINPNFSTAWRNLGIARYNVLHDSRCAVEAFARARALAPKDARIFYEQDQLCKRVGAPIRERLKKLESHPDLVDRRDDLSVELASLLNSAGRPKQALSLLFGRNFGPWEGGEGQVLTQYVRANVLLAQEQLQRGCPDGAVAVLKRAACPPENLSEAKHLLMNLSMIDYWMGVALSALGDEAGARQFWERAAGQKGDFQQMRVESISETTYWSAMALRSLGRASEAMETFSVIDRYATDMESEKPRIDYFATSLPAMLLFHEDLEERRKITARFLHAQAQLGLGNLALGRRLLEEVGTLDRSHIGAIDLLATLSESEG
jgi:tetratricopeptide (TPR) repeat protein